MPDRPNLVRSAPCGPRRRRSCKRFCLLAFYRGTELGVALAVERCDGDEPTCRRVGRGRDVSEMALSCITPSDEGNGAVVQLSLVILIDDLSTSPSSSAGRATWPGWGRAGPSGRLRPRQVPV